MRFIPCITALLLFCCQLKGQTSPQLSSSEIKAGLEKLKVTGRVLYIAAHPDDENTRLLAYLVNERKVRTGYLSLTRGDGGQNLIGKEQSEQLGLIRTQELLAARRIDGAEQFFTRANDFGFSKTSQETFKLWNKERILGDVVWIIRKFRPNVIITRFPGDARAGHGQHAASSILAQEAFAAAADPKRFPDQLTKVKPWKAERIFWNTYNFGSINTTSEEQLKINVGSYNSLLGKGYGEIASESRSQHKSQGFGVARQRGESYEYFTLLAGSPATKDLLEGVETGWSDDPEGRAIENLIDQINLQYNIERPQESIDNLLKLKVLVSQLKDKDLKTQKLKEIGELILTAGGIWFEAYAQEPSFAAGEQVPLRIQAISRSGFNPSLSVSFEGKVLQQSLNLPENQLKNIEVVISSGKTSQPYWLEEKHPVGEYLVKDQSLIGFPQNPDQLSVNFTLNIRGTELQFSRPIVFKSTDPIRGEVYRNLEITPPVVANLNSQFVFTDNKSQTVDVKLKALKDNSKGIIKPSTPPGWKVNPASIPFDLKNKGEEMSVAFQVSPGSSATSGKMKAEISTEGESFLKSIQTIEYDHIPAITWFPAAEATMVKIDLKLAGKKIGYIPGAGDLVAEALKQVGYEVTFLNENIILNSDLSRFDAIITGVRLYNVEPRMKFMNAKLLEYTRQGGVLLVQYNTQQSLHLTEIGPYPFTISRDRITEEDAAVKILKPEHKIFNYPNKITSKDFEGWIQERGIYHARNAEKYESLLSMKDTSEEEQTGSLIVADYGKGRFVYTGLSFFRQLPAGVPGAYRLFVNLISK